jgi:hypothetical protein
MAFRFCKACGGRYATVSGDGIRYFHVCPPQIMVTVKRGAEAIEMPIQLMQPGDVEQSRRDVIRDGAVNENVQARGELAGAPIAPGAGAIEADDHATLDAAVTAAIVAAEVPAFLAPALAPVTADPLTPPTLVTPAAGGQ